MIATPPEPPMVPPWWRNDEPLDLFDVALDLHMLGTGAMEIFDPGCDLERRWLALLRWKVAHWRRSPHGPAPWDAFDEAVLNLLNAVLAEWDGKHPDVTGEVDPTPKAST